MSRDSDGTEHGFLPYTYAPRGKRACPKWLADHPDWFRLPATMVRKAGQPVKPASVSTPQGALLRK